MLINSLLIKVMKRLLLTTLLATIASFSVAQSQHSWEQYLLELSSFEEEANYHNEENIELLTELEEHPINLNTATREDLERIPFLNAHQIEDILAYVYQYHGMETLGELAMIESIDLTRRQLLPYFTYVSKEESTSFPKLKDIFKYGKHELLLTGKVPFYTRKGDRNGYLGYRYPHSFRYTFQYSDYVKIGLVGAQDAGEPFFSNKNALGYDHYSFYVLIKKLGRLKALAVGRYKITLGQGLIINNSFGFGKLAMLQTLGRQSSIIRGHSSRSAYNYLQGAAATVALSKSFDLTGFISYRNIDATLTKWGGIQTILTTNYHRTPAEMSKKNNASQFITGGNLHWQKGGFHVGVTGLFTSFNTPLTPDTKQLYKRYAPAGNNFWNIGVSYGYLSHRWTLQGETATGNSDGIASMNALSWRAASNFTLLGVQRFYGYKYYSLFSEGFSAGGHIQNEAGLLVGANWSPLRGLSLMFYTDYAQYSHPRYRVHIGSKAWDNLVIATYSWRKFILGARYSYRYAERDGKKKRGLESDITQRGRLYLIYSTPSWTFKTQFDATHNSYLENSFGYMAGENVTYNPKEWLSLTANFGYFHTKDYASRIYVYERAPLYSFSFPSYYGQGIHYSVFAKAAIGKHLVGILRLSTTDYFDRDHISSSYQQIDRSSMTDLDLQLKWKF